MKLAFLAICTCPLIALSSADLASTYSQGETRTTEYSVEESSSLVDLSVLMNGEDSGMPGDMQQEKSRTFSGTFTDTILRASDGEVSSFSRTYADLEDETSASMSGPMGDQNMDSWGESDLDGLTVLFTKEAGGGFVATFPEDESGDDELLEGLEALLPWAEFLTDENVKIDDEWNIEPFALWNALNLGGNLSFVSNGDEGMLMSQDAAAASGHSLRDAMTVDGEITASLISIEDGIANFTLALEVDVVQDLSEAMRALAEEQIGNAPDGAMMPDIETLEDAREYEGEGTVLWHIDGGYMVSMELSLEFTETQSMVMSMSMGPDEMSIDQTLTSEGETELLVEVEVTRE